ncbi:MAG: hypothetical protein P4M11_03525 [Candidatus Pacebacteria bacterium]|nr:hypothetical protein [Candidatus Paceibacterota bacterium]
MSIFVKTENNIENAENEVENKDDYRPVWHCETAKAASHLIRAMIDELVIFKRKDDRIAAQARVKRLEDAIEEAAETIGSDVARQVHRWLLVPGVGLYAYNHALSKTEEYDESESDAYRRTEWH